MKKSILSLIILINLVLIYSTFSPQPDSIDSYLGLSIAKDHLDSYIQAGMDELNIPGLSFAITNHGEVVHQNSFGYANVAEGTAVTETTIFEGGSISKPILPFL